MSEKDKIKTLLVKKPLKLDCGQTISDFPLAYETYGKLNDKNCLLYTSPSPRDAHESRMPSSA